MRPDARLNAVLGIGVAAGTTTNGYALINQSGPGAGLQNVTLPFKGAANHYRPGRRHCPVADLYASRTLAAGRPAVVRFNQTATWSFDLARSTAYTRQGDPAFAGLDRDGDAGYVTSDIFFQTIDLERVGVPHADIQMRLFSRVITDLLVDSQPVPRLWYFPGTNRTLMVATADAHTNDAAHFAGLLGAVEGAGGRISLNLSRYLDPAGKPVATWAADGHDLGFHPYFTVDEDPDADFTEGYTRVANHFATAMPGIVPGPTARHHAGEWAGWIDPVAVMPGFGVRMNLDYYTAGPAVWNPTVDQQAHGYINGTGLPMRFVTTTGQVSPVYQQTTSLSVDQLVQGTHSEQLDPSEALAVSRQLIDASQAGGYSAIATQFQVEFYPLDEVKPWVDGTVAYAAAQQVPMWTAKRWLEFTEARAASTFTNYSWNAGTGLLSFSLTVPAGAAAQSLMVPPAFAGKVLSNATIDGLTVNPAALAVNGRLNQVIQVAPGAGGVARQVVLRYVLASSLPTVSIADAAAVEGNSGTSVVNLTVSLSAPSATDVIMGVVASNGTAAAGLDYQPIANEFVLIPASATSAPVQITIIGDTNYEDNETVVVTLSNPVGATLADATGVLTIQNDEPIIAVADAYATPFNTPLNVAAPGVLANDNAIGQPGLVATLVSTTPNGSLTLGANGAVSLRAKPRVRRRRQLHLSR